MSDTQRPAEQQDDAPPPIERKPELLSPDQQLIRDHIIRHRATLEELAKR